MKQTRKVFSLLLALCLMLGLAPMGVLAADDPTCPAHPAHDGACGYVAAVAGVACNHGHDGVCGYIEAVAGVECGFTHTHITEGGDACGYDGDDEASCAVLTAHTCPQDNCGYVAAVTGTDCGHTHDGACGFVQAVAESPCTHSCEVCTVMAILAAPVPTSPQAFRTSPKEAMVSFEIDYMPGPTETVTAYYVVQEAGALAPANAAAVKATPSGTYTVTAQYSNYITLSGLADDNAKDIYIVVESVTDPVTDPGVLSAVLTGTIPAWAPPELSDFAAERTHNTTATVTFSSTQAGQYKWLVKSPAESAPTGMSDFGGEGFAAMVAGENTIQLSGLATEQEYTVYIIGQNADEQASAILSGTVAVFSFTGDITIREADTTPVAFGGYRWLVIGGDVSSPLDGLALLAADHKFNDSQFNPSGGNNHYNGSTLQAAMDAAADRLASKEAIYVVPRNIAGDAVYNDGTNGVAGEAVNDARYWPLSTSEARAMGSDKAREFGDIWWLRSPGDNGSNAALVSHSGYVSGGGYNVDHNYAIRPALYLHLPSVLFTSGAAAGGARKFFIEDLSINAPTFTQSENLGNVYEYSGAAIGEHHHISCALVNSAGQAVYYKRLHENITSVSGNVLLPNDMTSGLPAGTYTLRLFSEYTEGDLHLSFVNTAKVVDTITVGGGAGPEVSYTDGSTIDPNSGRDFGAVIRNRSPGDTQLVSYGSAWRANDLVQEYNESTNTITVSDNISTTNGLIPFEVTKGTQGSIILTFQNAWLHTLPNGAHSLTFTFKDGATATVDFTVARSASGVSGLPDAHTLIQGQSVGWAPTPAGGVWYYGGNVSGAQTGGTATFTSTQVGRGYAIYMVNGKSHAVDIPVNSPTIPQTGDASHPLPFALLALASACGIGALLLWHRRARRA